MALAAIGLDQNIIILVLKNWELPIFYAKTLIQTTYMRLYNFQFFVLHYLELFVDKLTIWSFIISKKCLYGLDPLLKY